MSDRQKIEIAIQLAGSLLREIVRRSPEVRQHTDVDAFILNELNPALVAFRSLVEKFPPILVPAVDRRQCPDTDRLVELLRESPIKAAAAKSGEIAQCKAAITCLYNCLLVMSKHAGALEVELRRLKGLH